MSEKTIRVCDDCGINLEKVSFANICGLDICAKCERKVAEAHYSKSAKEVNLKDKLKKCTTCNGNGTTSTSFSNDRAFMIGVCLECYGCGYVRDHVPYGECNLCEKCSGSGTVELSCGLTNKCKCDGIL